MVWSNLQKQLFGDVLFNLCKLINWNRLRSDQKLQSQFPSYSRCFSSPPCHPYLYGFTAAPLQQVQGKKGAVWRQANLKAIIDHQPLWLVWLQCARCNWQDSAIPIFNKKYIRLHSITSKEWHHRRQFPKAKASSRICIHHSRQSDPAAFKLLSYCKCTIRYSLDARNSRTQRTSQRPILFYFCQIVPKLLWAGVPCWAEQCTGVQR